MPKFLTPIVGAGFRPPAKALLAALPQGAPLRLVREPENPYDGLAIRVECSPDALNAEATQRDDFQLMLAGYGFDMAAIQAAAYWHLGYVPKTHNAEPCEHWGDLSLARSATLRFTADCKPQVEFEL